MQMRGRGGEGGEGGGEGVHLFLNTRNALIKMYAKKYNTHMCTYSSHSPLPPAGE